VLRADLRVPGRIHDPVHAGRGYDIFDEREISRDGAIVVVRPDQYVAQVSPLDATAELAAFFDGILQQPK